MSPLLEIRDLHVSVDHHEILKGITLQVNAGEVHSIMGPNGSGKSTLAQVLARRDTYEVTSGEVKRPLGTGRGSPDAPHRSAHRRGE